VQLDRILSHQNEEPEAAWKRVAMRHAREIIRLRFLVSVPTRENTACRRRSSAPARLFGIAAMAQDDEMARQLMTIPGLGPVTASAMAASVQDVSVFSGAREFAAFLGLTPRQNSSGGKERPGRVSKMGNRYLRKLLVVGAHAVLYHRKPHEDALRSWAKKLMQTKPFKLVAVALANKMARIAFAIMRGKTTYSAVPA
jgi:transposase